MSNSLVKNLQKYNFRKYPIESVKNRVGTDWQRKIYTAPSVPDDTVMLSTKDGTKYGPVSVELYDALANGTLDSDLYAKLNERDKKVADEITTKMTVPLTTSDKKKTETISYDTALILQGKKPLKNIAAPYADNVSTTDFSAPVISQESLLQPDYIRNQQNVIQKVPVEDRKKVANWYNYETELAFKKYKSQQEATTDPKGYIRDAGYDPLEFSTDQYWEWAESHGFVPNDYGYGYLVWTYNPEKGKGRLPSDVDPYYILEYMSAVAESNAHRNESGDQGAAAAFINKYITGATFGFSDWLADEGQRAQHKRVGLSEDTLVTRSDMLRETYNNHKIAGGAGQIAGMVVSSYGIGGIVGKGLSALGWGAKTAPIARQAVIEGVTGFVRGGVTTATSGGNTQDVLLGALRDGLSSAVGGYSGARVTGTLNKLFTDTKYSGTVLNKLTRYATSSAGGLADAYTDWNTDRKFVNIANKFGADLEYRTGKDLITDFAVSLVLGTTLNMAKGISADGKARVETVSDSYAKTYRDFTNNADASNPANYIEAGKKVVLSGEEYKNILDSVGGNKEAVSDVKGFIDGINEGILKKINKVNNSSMIAPYVKKYNYDLDLAIGNIIDGNATFEDFKLFAPGNTANIQALYDATGIKLPNNKNGTFLNLLYITNKNAIHRDFPTYFYNKHYGQGNFNLDLYLSDVYNEYISNVKNADNIQTSTEHIKTRNEKLDGKAHPVTSVPFVRKTITVNDKFYDVVVSNFECKYDAQISKDLYLKRDKIQFKECNRRLLEAVESDPEIGKRFTEAQLNDIKKGHTPREYTWHHSEEPGKLQLVDKEIHKRTGHTGGRALWGGGSKYR